MEEMPQGWWMIYTDISFFNFYIIHWLILLVMFDYSKREAIKHCNHPLYVIFLKSTSWSLYEMLEIFL